MSKRDYRISKKKYDKAVELLIEGNMTDLNIVENFPPSEDLKTRDIVAEKMGIGSGKQYPKENKRWWRYSKTYQRHI